MTAALASTEDLAQVAIDHFYHGRFDDAERACRKLRNIAPNHPQALRILAHLRSRTDKPGAFAMLRRASAAAPDHGELHREVARSAMELGQFALAELEYRAALDIDGDLASQVDLSLCLIETGKWREGWQLYEARLPREIKHQGLAKLSKAVPLWDGRPTGTLLVHCEAGYGDMIQFARWLPDLRSRGLAQRIVFRVPRGLKPLMDRLEGIETLSTDVLPPPQPDAWCLVMQLAHLSGCERVEEAPAAAYLSKSDQIWSDRGPDGPTWDNLGRRPRVGIVWGGSPKQPRDKLRSLRRDALAILLQNDAVDWHILQVGPAAPLGDEVIRNLPDRAHIFERADELTDWEATARVIEGLDLVVTVDTAPAHLAASLGCPTWVLLGNHPDFRYPGFGDRTPWYGAMRLFRQEKAGDFVAVALKVNAALAEAFGAPIVQRST